MLALPPPNIKPAGLKEAAKPVTAASTLAAINASRQQFLEQSKGRINRLFRKMKWFLIRQNRKFNADDFSAFFSWIMMGNFIWIFIGTTTFVGLIIYLGNFFVGGELNKKLVQKLVTFDNNLEIDVSNPKFKATWEDGAIKFRNIKLRSKDGESSKYLFDVDTVNMTLSLNKWLDGHGLIRGIDISGLTGKLTISGHGETLDDSFDDGYVLSSFKISDSSITIDGPMFKKPFELDLFTCEMPRLRRPWLVYDFLNADALSGSFNGSLFALHKRQNRFAHFAGMDKDDETQTQSPWKKISRVRVDQVDLADIFTEDSKLNWLKSGKSELIVDMMLPQEDEEHLHLAESSMTLWETTKEELKKMWKSPEERQRVKALLLRTATHPTSIENESETSSKYVVLDFKMSLYDVKAVVPKVLPASSLTQAPYISKKDMQSLVAFINDKKFGLSSGASEMKSEEKIEEDESTTNTEVGNSATEAQTATTKDSDLSPFDEESTIPPLKFRIVQNLQNFRYIDFPALITLTNQDESRCTDAQSKMSFLHTNQLMDSMVSEAMSLLLLYKEEAKLNLMRRYGQRTGLQIFFNNSALGNLLLVGIGSLAI